MGLQDRRRASDLIESEYRARRAALKTTFTDADVERKAMDIAKSLKLSPTIAKLEKLREQVTNLEKQLAESVEKVPGTKAQKKYRNGCECHGDFQEMLTNAAKAALEAERNKDLETSRLNAEERRLLAQIETSETTEDIKSVLKKAGLIA